MKTSEIAVGTKCFTHVSGERVAVEVTQDRGGRGRRYLLARVDNGKPLTALRAASALHATAEGAWGGAFGEPLPSDAFKGPRTADQALDQLAREREAARAFLAKHVEVVVVRDHPAATEQAFLDGQRDAESEAGL